MRLSIFWSAVVILLFLLGLNKQLDFQTWILQRARVSLEPQMRRWLMVVSGFITLVPIAVGLLFIRDIVRFDTGVRLVIVGLATIGVVIAYRLLALPGASNLMWHIFSVDHGVLHTHLKEMLEIGALGIVIAGARSTRAR